MSAEGRPAESSEPDASPPNIPKGILRDYFETIVICVIFVIFARAFVFQQSKIPTGSMIPSLLIGDYIMVNKFVYAPASSEVEKTVLPMREIRRGDIIVFKYPEEPEVDYIKRVIGLPGELVEIRNKTVYIDGQALDEPYKIHETELNPESWARVKEGEPPLSAAESTDGRWPGRPAAYKFNFGQVLVPEDHYFCMGENRDNSKDSRAWGPVPRKNVKGKAFIIWWSFSGEEGDYVKTGVGQRVRSIGNKLIHFFPKSRYRRCLRFVT